jgi:hypothetical protein
LGATMTLISTLRKVMKAMSGELELGELELTV